MAQVEIDARRPHPEFAMGSLIGWPAFWSAVGVSYLPQQRRDKPSPESALDDMMPSAKGQCPSNDRGLIGDKLPRSATLPVCFDVTMLHTPQPGREEVEGKFCLSVTWRDGSLTRTTVVAVTRPLRRQLPIVSVSVIVYPAVNSALLPTTKGCDVKKGQVLILVSKAPVEVRYTSNDRSCKILYSENLKRSIQTICTL